MSYSVKFQMDCTQMKECAQELALQIGLDISDVGTPVYAEKGDRLSVKKHLDGILITYARKNEFFRGISHIPALLGSGSEICEKAKYSTLCYMADASRNAVPSIGCAKEMIRSLAAMGYSAMMLYTEDTYEITEYKYFGHMRGRYSQSELRELDGYADAFGIELIPCVQTLAHLSSAIRWSEIKELADTEDILMVGEEKTYSFIEAMIRTCSSCFHTKRIHIGMDEAHMIGRGRYLDKNGYEAPSDIMTKHLQKVVELCEKYGCEPMIWSDMFFRMAFDGNYYVRNGEISEEVRHRVPKGLGLVYWDYYSTDPQIVSHMLDCHRQFECPVIFAGGAWKWSGFGAHNGFSLLSTKMQLDMCEKYGVREIIATGWGDDGGEASQFSNFATLLYYAERCYGDEPSREKLNVRSEACLGIGFDALLSFDLPDSLNGAKAEDGDQLANPCKYLLYNDPLERFFDRHLTETASAEYAEKAERLSALSSHVRFGYAFETLAALCSLLSKKCDLGIRLYRAYQNKDRDALAVIADSEIPEIIGLLEVFTAAFRRQWLRENRSFGFTSHSLRLGGLSARLGEVSLRIKEYLSGNADSIEELECEALPMQPWLDGKYIQYNGYALMMRAGII